MVIAAELHEFKEQASKDIAAASNKIDALQGFIQTELPSMAKICLLFALISWRKLQIMRRMPTCKLVPQFQSVLAFQAQPAGCTIPFAAQGVSCLSQRPCPLSSPRKHAGYSRFLIFFISGILVPRGSCGRFGGKAKNPPWQTFRRILESESDLFASCVYRTCARPAWMPTPCGQKAKGLPLKGEQSYGSYCGGLCGLRGSTIYPCPQGHDAIRRRCFRGVKRCFHESI